MVLLSFLQVMLRNFFHTGIHGADIFLRHMVLWITFLGASLATGSDRHINIDILTQFLPGSLKGIRGIVINLFALLVCFILFIASWRFVAMEREGGSILFGQTPVWIMQIIIPLGFFLISFRFLVNVIGYVVDFFMGKHSPD